MKTNDRKPIFQAVRQLLAGSLADPAAIHFAAPATATGPLPHGYHSHDAWELFCPLRASLRFVIAGQPPRTIAARHLLLVPPGCLHIPVIRLRQPRRLVLLVMNLPGAVPKVVYGGWTLIRPLSATLLLGMTPAELAVCTARAGAAPGNLMQQVVQALEAGPWGRERALGLLRVLVAAYGEVISHPPDDQLSLDARRVAEAQFYLQSHYDEPRLSVQTVATALDLSASHLGALFRRTTGHTLHHALLDLRLRRATDLLRRTTYSIKEIAMLTGWSNQLYFSAAYHRRYGQSPTAVRPDGRIRGGPTTGETITRSGPEIKTGD